MKYIPFRVVRNCPYCQGIDVRRSHRTGALERIVLRLFLLRPYRCHTCTRRHYNFTFARRAQEDRPLAE